MINYAITPRLPTVDNPHDEKSFKLLPSIEMTGDAHETQLSNEPTVTITLTFSDAKYANIDYILFFDGLLVTRPQPDTIQIVGKFHLQSDLWNQGNGLSRIFLNYDNRKLTGPAFFEPFSINIDIQDNRGNTSSGDWAFTPPVIINNYQSEKTYTENSKRLFSDIFQFTPNPLISDEWYFEMYMPYFNTAKKSVGDFYLERPQEGTLVTGAGYEGEYEPRFIESVGPYNLNGHLHANIGDNCSFMYRIDKHEIEFWTNDVDLVEAGIVSKQRFSWRYNSYGEPEHIHQVFAKDDSAYISYPNHPNIIDVFVYNSIAQSFSYEQTIEIDNRYIHKEHILDGNVNELYDPAFFVDNDTMMIFCGLHNNDYVQIWKRASAGEEFIFDAEIELEHQPYRGVYWTTDRTFYHMTHNTYAPNEEHVSKLKVYRDNGTNWVEYQEITTPNTNTIATFKQNGISPFHRIVPSINTDLYFVHYINDYHGELFMDNGFTYENQKSIFKDFPGYNNQVVSMYFDSLYYLYPEMLGIGPQGFIGSVNSPDIDYNAEINGRVLESIDETIYRGRITEAVDDTDEYGPVAEAVDRYTTTISGDTREYRIGSFDEPIWNLTENNIVSQKQYIVGDNTAHGWSAHYMKSPSEDSLFKYGFIDNVFWGSTRKLVVERAPSNEINEIIRNIAYEPSYGYTRDVPIFWALRHATNHEYTTGGYFTLKTDSTGISDNEPLWNTPSGSLGSIYEWDLVDIQLSASDPEGAPITYTFQSGLLPPGSFIDAISGRISGPSVSVDSDTIYSFTIRASDGTRFADRSFSVVIINNKKPIWTTPSGSLGTFIGGTSVNIQLVVTNTDNLPNPTSFNILSGSLLNGLSLNGSTGVISGVLDNVTASASFTIRASDGFEYADRTFSINVAEAVSIPIWNTPSGSLGTFNDYNTLTWNPTTINIQLSATDPDPLTYSIINGSLPTGLGMDSNGLITGSLEYHTSSSIYTFTARVSDGINNVDRIFNMTVNPTSVAPSFATSSGSLGTFHEAENIIFNIVANDDGLPQPATMSIISGDLPPGVTMSAQGFISGQYENEYAQRDGNGDLVYDTDGSRILDPSMPPSKTWNFDVELSDTLVSVTRSFSITVTMNKPPVWITPEGNLGSFRDIDENLLPTELNIPLQATQGDNVPTQLVYSIVSGSLPLGSVDMDTQTGLISGVVNTPIPEVDTTYNFRVRVSDGFEISERDFSIHIDMVNEAPQWVTPAGSIGTFHESENISAQVVATDDGVSQNTEFSIVSGALPPGVNMDNEGFITGGSVPVTENTTYTFTAGAFDGIDTVEREFSITINNNIAPTFNQPAGNLGSFSSIDNVNILVDAVDGDGLPSPVSYSIVSGELPNGLILDPSTGTISGSPIGGPAVMYSATNNTVSGNTISSVSNSTATWAYSDAMHSGRYVAEFTLSSLSQAISVGVIDADIVQGSGLRSSGYSYLIDDKFHRIYSLGSYVDVPAETNRTVQIRLDVDNDIVEFWSGGAQLGSTTIPSGKSWTFAVCGGDWAENASSTYDLNVSVSGYNNLTSMPLGTYAFTIRATDGLDYNERQYSIEVVNTPPVWNNVSSSVGIYDSNTPVSIQLSADDPDGPSVLEYTVVGGALPSGMSMNTQGLITGQHDLVIYTNSEASEWVNKNIYATPDWSVDNDVSITTPGNNGPVIRSANFLETEFEIIFDISSIASDLVFGLYKYTLSNDTNIDAATGTDAKTILSSNDVFQLFINHSGSTYVGDWNNISTNANISNISNNRVKISRENGIVKIFTAPYGSDSFSLLFTSSVTMYEDIRFYVAQNATIITKLDPSNAYFASGGIVNEYQFYDFVSGDDWSRMASTTSFTVGDNKKVYFESKHWNTYDGSYFNGGLAGLMDINSNINTSGSFTATGRYGLYQSGNVYENGVNTYNKSLNYGYNNVILGYAIDFNVGKVWYSIDGVWDGDPVAGTGELLTLPQGTYLAYFAAAGGNASGANQYVSVNFGQQAIEGTMPTGYTWYSSTGGFENFKWSDLIPGQSTTFNFTVRADDSINYTDQAFEITVREPNTSPTWITNAGALAVGYYDQTYSVVLSANDPENNSLEYTIISGVLPDGITLNQYTGELSGYVENNSGQVIPPLVEYPFTVRVTDGVLSSDRSFTITTTVNPDIGNNNDLYGADGTVWFDGYGVRYDDYNGLTTTFEVPSGVAEIHVACVGAGQRARNGNAGGLGGELRILNNISVTPGQTFTINAPRQTTGGGYGTVGASAEFDTLLSARGGGNGSGTGGIGFATNTGPYASGRGRSVDGGYIGRIGNGGHGGGNGQGHHWAFGGTGNGEFGPGGGGYNAYNGPYGSTQYGPSGYGGGGGGYGGGGAGLPDGCGYGGYGCVIIRWDEPYRTS